MVKWHVFDGGIFMDSVSAVLAAGKILEYVTPLNKNCGNICGKKCCDKSEAGDGMLLFPGEESLYKSATGMFSTSVINRPFFSYYVTCSGVCDRSLRPLACRFFPVIPFIEQKNETNIRGIRIDTRAWPVCPLAESGITGLSAEFVNKAKEAASILLSCEETMRYIIKLNKFIDSYKRVKETGNIL